MNSPKTQPFFIKYVKKGIFFIVNNLIAIAAFSLVLLLAIPIGFYGMYLFVEPELPDMNQLQEPIFKMPLQVYTKDEVLIGEFGRDMSLPVTFEKIPKPLINAFLAAEDDSFFQHDGISIKGLGRAITESLTNDEGQTGGSTITMQVAKNYFLTPERTIKRKLTELFLARRIEQNLSKEEILTLYVNKIYLGQNAYGIRAAAKRYYGKSLARLSLAQMATIAGLPKSPSQNNPISNPSEALGRRNWILGRMFQLGYIDQAAYQQASSEPSNLNPYQTKVDKNLPYLAEWARYELVNRFGREVMSSGWRVKITVDSKMQDLADDALKRGLVAYSKRHGWGGPVGNVKDKPLSRFYGFDGNQPVQITKLKANTITGILKNGREINIAWYGARRFIDGNRIGYFSSNSAKAFELGDIVYAYPTDSEQKVWKIAQIPNVQGALVAINPDDGALVAMSGGYNFYYSKFNRVTQGWRQPGSIIKPFIYTLALEKGYRPNSLVSDEQLRVGSWRPRNSDGRYLGKIPLSQALYLSRNLVSIRLLQSVGVPEARAFLTQFGMTKEKLPSNLTLALGTAQVLPIQMATGYAAFANGGHRVQPYFISSIFDFSGNIIYLANPAHACAICYNEKLDQKNAIIKATNANKTNTSSNAETTQTASKQVADAGPNTDRLKDFISTELAVEQAPRIISADVAYDMANILKDVVIRGTAKKAQSIGRSDIGGKTGTTNEAKDAWFAGFHPTLAAVAWVGFDKPESLGRREYGGVAALPIWTRFMGLALKDTPHQWVSVRNLSQSRKEEIKIIDTKNTKVTNEEDVSLTIQTDFKLPPEAYYIQKPRPKPTYKPELTTETGTNASVQGETNPSALGGIEGQLAIEKPDFDYADILQNNGRSVPNTAVTTSKIQNKKPNASRLGGDATASESKLSNKVPIEFRGEKPAQPTTNSSTNKKPSSQNAKINNNGSSNTTGALSDDQAAALLR